MRIRLLSAALWPIVLFCAIARGETFDVNDVSFLIPLPADADGVAAMPSLQPSGSVLSISRSDYETLVPSSVKKWIFEPHIGPDGKPSGGVPNPLYEMSVFKTVGVRVDPCAKDDPKAPPCRLEVRLVLQPILFEPDPFKPGSAKIARALDAAIHLIYVVPEEERPELLALVRHLNQLAEGRTKGIPLGVHPVLKKEGLSGPYGVTLLRLVSRFAWEERLQIATHMFTEQSDRWFFFKTERRGNRLVSVPVPFVGTPSQEVFSTGDHIITVRNPSTSSDNVNQIVDSMFGSAGAFFKLSKPEQTRLVNMALRIDDPLRHTPATLDCVSCHCATRAAGRAMLTGSYVNLKDGNPNRYPTPPGVSGDLVGMELDNPYSVRSFGYFFTEPSLTKGVVNDSARIAAWLNRRVDVAY